MAESFLKRIVDDLCTETVKHEFIDKISDTVDIDRVQLEAAYDNGFRSSQHKATALVQAKVEVYTLIEKYQGRRVKAVKGPRRNPNPVAKFNRKANTGGSHRSKKDYNRKGYDITKESTDPKHKDLVAGIIARANKHRLDPEFVLDRANHMAQMGKTNAAKAWREAGEILQQTGEPQFEGDSENREAVAQHKAIQKQANIYAANMLKNGKGADFALQQALLAKRSGNINTFKAWRMAAKKIAANDRKMAGNYMEDAETSSDQLYAVKNLKTGEWVTKPSKSLKGQKSASRRKNMEYGAERFRPCSYPDGKIRGYS